MGNFLSTSRKYVSSLVDTTSAVTAILEKIGDDADALAKAGSKLEATKKIIDDDDLKERFSMAISNINDACADIELFKIKTIESVEKILNLVNAGLLHANDSCAELESDIMKEETAELERAEAEAEAERDSIGLGE